jgi:hypothetical protein
MKANIAGGGSENQAHELTTDLAILVQLSTVRDAQIRLARERAVILAASPARGRPVEQSIDQKAADPVTSGPDLSPRLEALAKEQATADEQAGRLEARLSPDVRRIYASLSIARRPPFVATLKGDCCSGCNMRLPSALLGEVRRVRRLYVCPSCKRVLSPPSLEA